MSLRKKIESSLTVVVSDADQDPQLLTSEDESILVPGSETPVIDDLKKYDSVEDVYNGGEGNRSRGIGRKAK
ncbi:hypothetical protein RYX36_032766 [Vicia faba]